MAYVKHDPASVLVADDHPVFRDALGAAIGQAADLELVALASEGFEAQAKLEELRPDVAVLDVEMPGLSGPQLASWLSEKGLPTRVLFLSSHRAGPIVYDALASGGYGYVTKDMPMRDIVAAVDAVAAGQRSIPVAMQEVLLDEMRARADRDAVRLTEREQSVLELAGRGSSVAEMAAEMHLSAATIKSHLSTLYAKLGASDRAEAVAEAMRRGLLR